MRVESIPRQRRSVNVRCHNNCQKQNSGYYTPATHRVWLVEGWPTPLCTPCKNEWERIYDDALGVREEVAA